MTCIRGIFQCRRVDLETVSVKARRGPLTPGRAARCRRLFCLFQWQNVLKRAPLRKNVRERNAPAGRRRKGTSGQMCTTQTKRVAANATTLVLQNWCRGRDSNPHSYCHYPLKIACLPVPPPRRQKPLGKSFFRAFSVPAASFSSPRGRFGRRNLEHFQFAMLRISNHTACRFVEKAWLFRSLWAGRRWTPRVSPLSTLKGSTDAVSFPASRTAARCPRPCRREIPDRGISFRHLWQRAYRKSSVRPGS